MKQLRVPVDSGGIRSSQFAPWCRVFAEVSLMTETMPEADVLEQIRRWAQRDENIRTVILTSSRADPDRVPDALSDYDVELFVRDTGPFVRDDDWLDEFGPILVRWPRRPGPTGHDDWVTQLVLFESGIRIDFQITARPPTESDNLDAGYRVIIDKDSVAATLPAPTYSKHAVKLPSADEFADRVNAFFWDIVYVAKGLWRGELNYAKSMVGIVIRFEQVVPISAWYIRVVAGHDVNIGIYGRWMHRFLDAPMWNAYLATFAGADPADNRRALFATLEYVRTIARRVASELGFEYPEELDARVTRYIETIMR